MGKVAGELKVLVGRLKEAVRAGGGNAKVAKESRVPLSTLNSYLAGEADPKATKLAKIARACGVTLDYLMGGAAAGTSPDSRIPDDFALIPRLDVRVSAGHGALPVPRDEDSDFIAFRSSWLRRHGIDPHRTEMIEAAGDSMTPTIGDGDLLLVDRTFNRVMTTGIYVLLLDEMLHVRRVQMPTNGKIVLTPDNPRYRETVIDLGREGLTILGLVRFVFHKP